MTDEVDNQDLEHENIEDSEADASRDEEERVKSRLETLIPKLVKKAISQGVEVLSDERAREKVVGEVVRRAIDTGGAVAEVTEDSVKRIVQDLQLGKEVTERLLGRLDDLRSDAGKIMKDELAGFLSQLDLTNEMRRVLDGMVMEVKTEIRFKYDGDSSEDGIVEMDGGEDV